MNIISIAPKIRAAVMAAVLCVPGSGCYLLQSAQGQLALMSKRKPIGRVIDEPSTPASVRTQLLTVTAIREFASRELALPDSGSYRSYADVGRPFAVWNVFAAPEFSLQPKQWCYPIVGCVAYRGYFAERRARALAKKLRAQGLDVSVAGVAAYSTLGHFNDPILNTMLGWSDIQLASIIFHELTHQLLYVPNDASFNEALATLVEEEGVRRWLVHNGRDADLANFTLQQTRSAQVLALLIHARGELATVYASGAQQVVMRERKRAVFAALTESYERLKAGNGGRAPYGNLFSAEINNAHLVSVATYRDCVPGFERALAAVGGDLMVFFTRVRKWAKLPRKQRDALVCSDP